MKMHRFDLLFAALFVLAVFPASAFAYLDPGTGSYVLQLAIGFILGSLWAIKMGWHRISAFVKNVFSRGGADQQQ